MDSCDACVLFCGLPVQFEDYQLEKYTKLRTVFEFLFRRKYSNKTHNCITGINKLMAQIGYDTHGIKTPDALRLAVFDQSRFNATTD